MRTADLLALVQPGQALYVLPMVAGGRFCPMGGGVPLFDVDGQVYAGVGVSGGTAEEDTAIVEAAVRYTPTPGTAALPGAPSDRSMGCAGG